MHVKMLDHEAVLSLLPDRPADTHKGSYGRVLLLCGSVGYTGAAALAAMGALRSGTGLVYLGVPQSIYSIEAAKLLEPVVFPLGEQDGMLGEACIPQILEKLKNMDAVLVGPGLGQSAGTFAVVKTVLEKFDGPVVVDADGINALSGHTDILRGRKAVTVITPHPGEFVRVGGEPDTDKLLAAEKLAKELGVVVVLKGHGTVITDGDTSYQNPTGNPGMAVGGCGDVLAGMIVSLLGQGIPALDASACAVWLHGKAGDLCAQNIGQYGMLPSDMLNVLPRLMK